MTMKQNMSSVYQPGKCEDSLKSLRILIYVISGLTIIMYFYYMLPTAIFPHRVMQTTLVNEEKYGDGLEPMPYTMRVVAILQYLMATMGLLSSFYLGHGVYFRERLLMLPWMFFSLMTIVWIGFDLVMDQMYGKITTESFYFNMAIDLLCIFPWTIVVVYFCVCKHHRPAQKISKV